MEEGGRGKSAPRTRAGQAPGLHLGAPPAACGGLCSLARQAWTRRTDEGGGLLIAVQMSWGKGGPRRALPRRWHPAGPGERRGRFSTSAAWTAIAALGFLPCRRAASLDFCCGWGRPRPRTRAVACRRPSGLGLPSPPGSSGAASHQKEPRRPFHPALRNLPLLWTEGPAPGPCLGPAGSPGPTGLSAPGPGAIRQMVAVPAGLNHKARAHRARLIVGVSPGGYIKQTEVGSSRGGRPACLPPPSPSREPAQMAPC